MNFKDIYKKANDEIKGDRSILEGIYKKKKIHHINIVRPLATCAASLILVVAISSLSDFHKDNIEKEVFPKEIKVATSQNNTALNIESTEKTNIAEIYALKGSNDETTPSLTKQDRVSTTSDMPGNNTPIQSGESTQNPIDEVSSPHIIDVATEDTASNGIAPASFISDLDSQGLSYEGEDDIEDCPSISGQDYGSSTYNIKDTSNEVLISFDEFLSLSAFNVESLYLDGFTISFPEYATIIKNSDNIIEYYFADIILQNGDKKITVTVSKKTSEQMPYVEKSENTTHTFFSSGKNDILVKAENVILPDSFPENP